MVLPVLLSLVAGSADAISFLGLGGVFVAHVTGNLIILAARLAADAQVGMAPILSVPVFVVVLILTRLLAAWLHARRVASLGLLLLVQLLLLGGFLGLGVAAGTHAPADAPLAVAAVLVGVAGLAVQNALVQISIKGSPSTAVMTTNITRFIMDVGEVLFGDEPAAAETARRRAVRAWPAIIGFAAGAAAGAALYAAAGIAALALPAGVALVALLDALGAGQTSR